MVIGKNKERWEELCELAANEGDPKKLIELMNEINRLLEITTVPGPTGLGPVESFKWRFVRRGMGSGE
jgi:hypothetical protein